MLTLPAAGRLVVEWDYRGSAAAPYLLIVKSHATEGSHLERWVGLGDTGRRGTVEYLH
jgi:hypothetical protein